MLIMFIDREWVFWLCLNVRWLKCYNLIRIFLIICFKNFMVILRLNLKSLLMIRFVLLKR